MNETELKQSIAMAQQDAETLDYSKWADRQRQSKLPTNHDLWQRERDNVLARQQSDNAESRRKYLASLESARKAKKAETDAELDQQLEPQKQMLMREWLANHPDKTTDDFNKSAWIHLRENLVEQRKAVAVNAELLAQQATGRYTL
jgi:hypothetical protein